MAEKINKEIIKNYTLYTKVKSSIKKILSDKIILEEDSGGHSHDKVKVDDMSHKDLDQLNLHIRFNVVKNKYTLGLRSPDICPKPFFRFDSAGPSHRNKGTELAIQQITTPHFQSYNNEGINIAYKTEEIKNDNIIKEIINDINKGFQLFCDESKSYFNKTEYPKIIAEKDTLNFPKSSEDPLEGIKFE